MQKLKYQKDLKLHMQIIVTNMGLNGPIKQSRGNGMTKDKAQEIREALKAYQESAQEYDTYCERLDGMPFYKACRVLASEEHEELLQKVKHLEAEYFRLVKEAQNA